MELFVTLRHTQKNWVAGTPARRQLLWDEHAEFMDRLYDTGKIALAGPFTDGSGALVIVRVENEQEAHTIFDDDPWVKEEMLDGGEVKHWQIFLNALNPPNPVHS